MARERLVNYYENILGNYICLELIPHRWSNYGLSGICKTCLSKLSNNIKASPFLIKAVPGITIKYDFNDNIVAHDMLIIDVSIV